MAQLLLDKLKRSRKAARSAFSKAFTVFSEEINQEELIYEDIQVAFQILESRSSELDTLNTKICEAMVELTADKDDHEKIMEDEYEVADEYTSKYLRARIEVNKLNKQNQPEQRPQTFQNIPTIDNESKRRFKLPKIELRKFGGDLKDWLQFWSQFKNIHDDKSITKEDKFQYLIQAMIPNSRAADLVNSFPPTNQNYDKVIDSLKSRFGKDELLVEVYVRELLTLVISNAVKSNEEISLAKIYDKLEAQLRALESLGVTKDKCAAMLYPLVESSLPEELIRTWQRQATTMKCNDIEERLTKLTEFLQHEVENEERIRMAVSGFNLNDNKPSSNIKFNNKKKIKSTNEMNIPTATGLLIKDGKNFNQSIKTYTCIFCGEEHRSSRCGKAKQMSLDDKWNIAKENNCCFNCLIPGHNTQSCRINSKCQWCGKKHSILLCRGILNQENTTRETTKEDSSKFKQEANLANLSLIPEVCLQTVRVILKNGDKKYIVRALMDSGSQRSYISKRAAEEMKYQSLYKNQVVHLLFGGTKTEPQDHKGYLIHLESLNNQYSCNFMAFDQDIICHGIPSVNNGPWVQELLSNNIILTDVSQTFDPIDILIGVDILGKLMTGRLHNLKCGMTAIETRLGWTLMGKKPNSEYCKNDAALTVTSMFIQEADISQLWSLDVLGITDPIETKSKKIAEEEVCKKFRETVIINKDKRYEICLPWKENHPQLETNKEIAQKRLQITTEKLKKQGLYEEYDQVLTKWLEEGIIEKVPVEEENIWGHYLPHRHVLKVNSTTRLRPVFDASAKSKDGVSLNQCLETGPNLIELIPSMLLRFREKEIGVISDIEKAFLQISITPKDRDVLRFLWWKENDVIEILRHARVVFGVTSSPFILAATIKLHLEFLSREEKFKDMLISIFKLISSFYVDNCVTSVDSLEELHQFKEESIFLMAEGGFNLRGWEYTHNEEPHQLTSVLGLTWDKKEDVLMLKISNLSETIQEKITKRVILSISHKVFDPIGFACPALLFPKLLLQTINNLKWDTEVPQKIKEDFEKWYHQLKLLKEVKIPRWISSINKVEKRTSFHVFVDASQVAYAAVIFMRTQTELGTKIQLIAAKSRVSPSKEMTIPRLELLAANIGARLMKSVSETMNCKQEDIYFWSDSTTVLTWIKQDRQWATFVWNRVQEIRNITNTQCWRYVPGVLNPADLPSRGCTTGQLIESKWWEGPDWLYNSEDWPVSEFCINNEEINSELKKSAIKEEFVNNVNLNKDKKEEDDTNKKNNDEWHFNSFSRYSKTVRMFCWMKRFIHYAQVTVEPRKGEITAKEFCLAEKDVLRLVQRECFSGNQDPRIKDFRAYTDENGLLRTKTLISNREDNSDFLEPIILDPNHPVVLNLIKYYHEKLQHAGVQTVLNEIREKFWILQGRKFVRAVMNKCVICKRYKASHVDAEPTALPKNRVKNAVPFEISGVDFAGPVYLKENEKSWICLFTCAVYRAVHLELITSLSTEAFLEGLRRFIARRGRPAIIYSDNGTNFTGTKNCLLKIDWDKIKKYSSVEKIEWYFNPPSAAWWGGWWERLVRVMKELLRKVLKRSSLTYEEMCTTLCDCEAIINSRPITYHTDDINEPRPLSPAMFLMEAKSTEIPDLDCIDSMDFKKRFRYRQNIRDNLRQRFRIEYLGQLSRKQPQMSHYSKIQLGEIVLVGDDNTKRLNWPLAKVIGVIPGKDGKIRVVKLKTANGQLTRPVQRIYQLEVQSPNEQLINQTQRIIGKVVELQNVKKISLKEKNQGEDRDSIKETVTTTRYGRHVKIPKRLGVEK